MESNEPLFPGIHIYQPSATMVFHRSKSLPQRESFYLFLRSILFSERRNVLHAYGLLVHGPTLDIVEHTVWTAGLVRDPTLEIAGTPDAVLQPRREENV